MKFDFRRPILDLRGEPIKEGDKPFLLSDACQTALTASFPDEATLAAAGKVSRFALALKIGEPLPQDITPEELVDIKKLVAKAYGPLIVGRVYQMLDEKSAV